MITKGVEDGMGDSLPTNRTQPWKDDYEVPQGEDRCPANYDNKHCQCRFWKDYEHKMHWAMGGNIEWLDGEEYWRKHPVPAAVPEAKPEPPVTGNRSELTFDLTDPAQCIAASGAVKALHDAGFALPVRDAGYVTPSGAIASLSTPAQPPANPLSPQDDSDAMLILECFGFLRSMDHFYGEEYVPEDSSAQTCITNIRRIINMPPIKAAAPKVVDSKEELLCPHQKHPDEFCDICQPNPEPNEAKVEEQDGEQEPSVGELFYDGIAYLMLQTKDGPTMFAEIRGHGAGLPQDANAKKLCDLWNKAKSVDSLSPSEPTRSE